ncbi:hypothetical protein HUO13_28595 [Saccharopolyspora erythraea]|uniref:hypothetical protein n=1 Tax=Saccharopolyspora erythraea TaxID=1836 RepID=UPI001BACDDFB|nr:hypothetical protein [Saccharopolyspora erythraea]QUH04224.1 hypothetical protein HUO13_28595 [Saccharopolyspora erythraea]
MPRLDPSQGHDQGKHIDQQQLRRLHVGNRPQHAYDQGKHYLARSSPALRDQRKLRSVRSVVDDMVKIKSFVSLPPSRGAHGNCGFQDWKHETAVEDRRRL